MLSRFLRDRRANVLPIFAIAAVPLIVSVGAVVDYTNAFDQRLVVQSSMDAAALAAGKQIGILQTHEEIQARADEFFAANVQPSKVQIVPELDTEISGSTVDINTTLHVPTYFLGLIGLEEFVFNLHSQVTVGMGTLEVALALDNSGSMCAGCTTEQQALTTTKIGTLRTAATDLIDTLFDLGATSTKPDPVKIAVIPFAGSVNVGASNRNSGWMDTTGVNPYHGENFEGASGSPPVSTNSPAVNVFNLYDSLNGVTWGGCVEERPAPYDVQDDAAVVGTPSTMFVPTFAPDEPDSWTCSTSTCNFAGTTNSTRRYVGAGAANTVYSYNNYLPDADGGSCGTTFNTFTVTSATPAVLTKSAHALATGTEIVVNSSGSLYTGLTKGTSYYVATVPNANTFTLTTQSTGTAFTMTPASALTFTVTRASPAVFTRTSHGLTAGTAIKLSTTGALYTGLNTTSTYYVISTGLSTNSFRVSTTSGGSAVNTSGSQSGTHSYTNQTPTVFTSNSHGFSVGNAISLTTTGSLPTGLATNTVYYVVSVPNSNTFTLSATSGGAGIVTTGTQSGTHRFFKLVNTSGSQSGTHNYALATKTAEWTCQSGTAGCGGTGIGIGEQTALLGQNISANPLCKYGTVANKATPTSMIVDISGYGDDYAGGPNLLCTTQSVQTLTADEATADAKIAAMIGAGSTNITSGLMWGWRALSETAPFTEGRAYSDPDTQ
jgi:Flp pilus assembly protein TadG